MLPKKTYYIYYLRCNNSAFYIFFCSYVIKKKNSTLSFVKHPLFSIASFAFVSKNIYMDE